MKIRLTEEQLVSVIKSGVRKVLQEYKMTSYDSLEWAEERKRNEALKKAIKAKMAAKAAEKAAENGEVPQEQPVRRRKPKKSNLPTVVGFDEVDTSDDIIATLKRFFLLSGKEGSDNQSEKRMRQFLKYTDYELSKKNIAGGAIFTDANREKMQDDFGRVFELVQQIRRPAMEIAYYLRTVDKFDADHILILKNKLLDLEEALPAADAILHEPVVKQAIKDGVPFWVGGSAAGGGHNVGFRDVLRQFIKDMKNATYEQLANRLDDFVSQAKDPFSYRT